MAAIEHLDNATVIFVMDLTGECGTAVRDQVRRLFFFFLSLGSAQASRRCPFLPWSHSAP